jgi:hypothetical protein
VSGTVATTAPGGTGGAQLPITGARVALLAGLALTLLFGGGLLVAGARRRTMFGGPGAGGPSHR